MSASRHPDSHPNLHQLALLAGGELGLWSTFVLRRHTRHCAECRAGLASFEAASRTVRESALTLPPGLNWDRLAGEMKANIRLGLTAGEIAGPIPAMADPRQWQALAVAASLAFVLFSGWFLSRPHDFYHRFEPPVARVTGDGIGVAERGSAMTLLAPASGAATTTAEVGVGLQAQYVDADSGQVTIHHVFTE